MKVLYFIAWASSYFVSRQLTHKTVTYNDRSNGPWLLFKKIVLKRMLHKISQFIQLCCNNEDFSPTWFCFVEIMTGTISRIQDRDPSALCVIPTRLERTIWGIVQSLTPAWLHHNFLLTKRSKFFSLWKGRNEPRTHKKIVNSAVFVVFQWRHAPRLSIHVVRRCFLYSCASARDQTRRGDKHPPPQPRSRHNRGSVTQKNPNLTLGSFVSRSSVHFLLAALRPWDSIRVMERMLYQTALNAPGLHYCDTVRRVKIACTY